MTTRCDQELCEHWPGDGDVCVCTLLGVERTSEQRYDDDDDRDEPFDCAANGHGPDIVVMADGAAIKAYCRCAQVVWLPRDDPREGR